MFIIDKIQRNPLATITEMSEALGVTTRTVDRDIALLREAGYIAKSGKDNRSPWVVLKSVEG